LWLYPLGFRRRYGEEMQAMLDEAPPRLVNALDLVRGALMAHVRPPASTVDAVSASDRVRASASGVLACWVLFAAAGFGFYKTTEDHPFSTAGHAHPLLRDAHLAVQAFAVLASISVVIGALPLIAAALTQARRDGRVRRSISAALLPVIAFAGFTGLLLALARTEAAGGPSVGLRMAFVVWAVAGLVCGEACVLGCRASLFALALPRRRLLGALTAASLVTAAMLVIASATALYATALGVDASDLARAPNGPFQLISTLASLIVQVAVMALAGALAITSLRRGWRVAGQLPDAS
jgi:hypothetical protein